MIVCVSRRDSNLEALKEKSYALVFEVTRSLLLLWNAGFKIIPPYSSIEYYTPHRVSDFTYCKGFVAHAVYMKHTVLYWSVVRQHSTLSANQDNYNLSDTHKLACKWTSTAKRIAWVRNRRIQLQCFNIEGHDRSWHLHTSAWSRHAAVACRQFVTGHKRRRNRKKKLVNLSKFHFVIHNWLVTYLLKTYILWPVSIKYETMNPLMGIGSLQNFYQHRTTQTCMIHIIFIHDPSEIRTGFSEFEQESKSMHPAHFLL